MERAVRASIDIPTFETSRLELRGHRIEDLEVCAAMWGDPAVTRHIGGRPFSREEVWSKLLRYLGHWSALQFGYWVVVEKSTQRFVGEVGLADFKREMSPSIEGTPESGWVLARSAHGKGFATEAVQGALAWFESRFGPLRTVCMIDPSHVLSIRVADKCGYRELLRTSYKGQPTIVFQRP